MTGLRYGDQGSLVGLLQLGLRRAGFDPGALDGIFGYRTQDALLRFQRTRGLAPDAIAGRQTHAALRSWYTGYTTHRIRSGDTFYRLAGQYGSSMRAIEIANPSANALQLQPGTTLVIPFSFDVVPTEIPYSSELITYCVEGLSARYPSIRTRVIGRSVMGRSLYALSLGTGENRVLYNASHHANEWITTPLLLSYLESLAYADAYETAIGNYSAQELLRFATICIIPAVNPDGIDLVTGAIQSGRYFEGAVEIAEDYPDIPFPSGWKANILGTDLNLQYPAGWEQAKEIKFAQGYLSPAPRDYVGPSALSAQESRAMYDFTLQFDPALTLSYHSQGNTIFWKYLDYEPEGSRAIAQELGRLSGYAVAETPYASGFAGYKDWFIQEFNRPGYTVEVGLGNNPLPLSQFPTIYADNEELLTYAMIATAGS